MINSVTANQDLLLTAIYIQKANEDNFVHELKCFENVEFPFNIISLSRGRYFGKETFSMHEQKECESLLSILCDELPATFECRRLGSTVYLNLEKTESFMNMRFKPSSPISEFFKNYRK